MSGIARSDELEAGLELGRQFRDLAAAYARKVAPRKDLTARQKALQVGQTVGQCLFQAQLTDGRADELVALVHGLGVALGSMLQQLPPEAVEALEHALITGAEAGIRECGAAMRPKGSA